MGYSLIRLSGGGQGAIPPDLDLGNTCMTVIDLAITPLANVHGDGVGVAVDAARRMPVRAAMGWGLAVGLFTPVGLPLYVWPEDLVVFTDYMSERFGD